MSMRLPRRSHCPAKLSTSDEDRGSFHHPLDLPLEHGRVLEFALAGQRDEFVVRSAAPEEVGQARGQFQIADAVSFAGTHAGRSAFEPENEFHVQQCGLQRRSDPAVEGPVLPPHLVLSHQGFQVLRSRGPAVRLTGETGNDLGRTVGFLAGRGWPTAEDFPTAGCFGNSGHVHRTRNPEILQVRQRCHFGMT